MTWHAFGNTPGYVGRVGVTNENVAILIDGGYADAVRFADQLNSLAASVWAAEVVPIGVSP